MYLSIILAYKHSLHCCWSCNLPLENAYNVNVGHNEAHWDCSTYVCVNCYYL